MRWMLFVTVLLGACGSHAPHAPDNIADLMPYFFQNWETGQTETIAEAAVNLANAATVVTIGHPMKAELDALPAAAIASLGLKDHDPSSTAGLIIVNIFKCNLPQLEKILIDTDQSGIYPGNYDAYSRTYTSSRDDYLARKVPNLTWSAGLTSTNLVTMSETLIGGMRYVPDQGGGKSPWGPALVQRTYLPSQAVFDGTDNYWRQDYQIEVYMEIEPNRILHAYATWRELHVTDMFVSGGAFYTSKSLDNMVSWDQSTEDACAAGKE